MADLSITTVQFAPFTTRFIPTWVSTVSQDILNVDISGTLSGTLTKDTVAEAGATVILRYRSNDELIKRAITNATGGFTFYNLELGQAKYFAYAYTEGAYNVARFDKLVPV